VSNARRAPTFVLQPRTLGRVPVDGPCHPVRMMPARAHPQGRLCRW